MVIRLAVIALALVAARPAYAAQAVEAEAAFRHGDYRAARTAYEQVLARDSINVRALYRLAIMDSWDGALDRSLARFRALRRLEPRDPDFAVAHARVLSWAGRHPLAIALYDSVLVSVPGRADALAGRARTVAWSGDLGRAEQLWRAALALHPDDPEIQVGMAQTLLWRGQPALAEGYAARARQLAPEDRPARDVLDLIRAALAPELATNTDYSHDSDRNALFTQRASYSISLGAGRRGTVYGAGRRATDPVRAGGSYSFGARVAAPLSRVVVGRAALGAQVLSPDSGGPYTAFTPQLGVSMRLSHTTVVTVGWQRSFFDETALLLRRHFVTNAVDVDAEFAPLPRVRVTLGGGSVGLPGNRRWSGVAAIIVSAGSGLEVGALARSFGYATPNPGMGYFAPDFFGVIEARGRYERRWGRWGVSGDGGIGAQQVGTGAARQAAWHARLVLSRGWQAANELTLSGSVTNSAAVSATGAYRSWSVALQWRQGL